MKLQQNDANANSILINGNPYQKGTLSISYDDGAETVSIAFGAQALLTATPWQLIANGDTGANFASYASLKNWLNTYSAALPQGPGWVTYQLALSPSGDQKPTGYTLQDDVLKGKNPGHVLYVNDEIVMWQNSGKGITFDASAGAFTFTEALTAGYISISF